MILSKREIRQGEYETIIIKSINEQIAYDLSDSIKKEFGGIESPESPRLLKTNRSPKRQTSGFRSLSGIEEDLKRLK